MKQLLPVLAAGSSFAGCALAGLLIGIYAAGRTGQPLWTLGCFFAGLALGGYAAYRLFAASM